MSLWEDKTYRSLELGRRVFRQPLIERAENRRSGVDKLDPDVGRDQGICLPELLAVYEIVQFGCQFRSCWSSANDDPGEQSFAICVAQPGKSSASTQTENRD